ncbi:MAG: bifunctional nuclease family protein [Spirochaetota bacterium]
MKKDVVEFSVKGIALDKDSQMPLVILQAKNKKILFPIWIGPFEASSIIIEMEGVHPPRPLAHDLLANFILRHGFRVQSLEIYGMVDNKYLAKIHYKKGLRSYSMEVRPSDGIAISLRLGAPILSYNNLIKPLSDQLTTLKNRVVLPEDFLFLDAAETNPTLM